MIDGQWADFGERLLILAAALDISSWYLEWTGRQVVTEVDWISLDVVIDYLWTLVIGLN